MDDLEIEVDDILNGISLDKKISKRYECSSLTRGQIELDVNNKEWLLSIFLTPPSSPDYSPNYEAIFNEKRNESLTDDSDEIDVSRTKDLNSMLIRDCMWNGESPKKGQNFEKLRPLTKTPPLIDCNLRIMYVDPSEIWPFNFNEQLKAGKTTTNDNNTEEDVEVDVVGLEGSSKIEEKKKVVTRKEVQEEVKVDRMTFVCDVQSAESKSENENTDHDYSCKLRSGTKRRSSSDSESDKENYTEQKTRVLSGDESDIDCEILGRASHNVLERKRRNELKLRFQYLRDSIPEICGNDRTPKVSILQKAYNYILQLQAEERNFVQQIRIQKNRKEQLLKKVLEMQNDNLSF